MRLQESKDRSSERNFGERKLYIRGLRALFKKTDLVASLYITLGKSVILYSKSGMAVLVTIAAKYGR